MYIILKYIKKKELCLSRGLKVVLDILNLMCNYLFCQMNELCEIHLIHKMKFLLSKSSSRIGLLIKRVGYGYQDIYGPHNLLETKRSGSLKTSTNGGVQQLIFSSNT